MFQRLSLFLALLCGAALSQAAPANQSITLYSDGIRLAGNLWLPEGLKTDERRPAILMVHGWGGQKAHLNKAYAPHFAELGYVVLTFDYTGWGESEGMLIRTGDRPKTAEAAKTAQTYTTEVQEIRRIVNPLEQLDDIRAAFAYLSTTPQVDPERIAVWGSSLGGGLALAAACEFPQIKVLMTQVGAVNPNAERANVPPGDPISPAGFAVLRGAIARGEMPAFPSEGTPGLRGYPDWPDFVRYNPQQALAQLQAATLIIEADKEELMDNAQNGKALFKNIKNQVPASYGTVEGKHYDIYQGAGYSKALRLQKAWLAEHLPIQ